MISKMVRDPPLRAGHQARLAIPWDLIVWAVPGAMIGAVVGTHLQGRVGERASWMFFGSLFLVIGIMSFVTFAAYRFG